MKSAKREKKFYGGEEQSLGGRIATVFQMIFAIGCAVLFFFPFFKFLDADSVQFATLSQYQLLFGGVFPKAGMQTIRVSGSLSSLTGILVPIFVVLVLYFRNSVRRMFAYIFHALVSVAFLIYIFSTKSVASSIARVNADAANYQLDWAWFAVALLTVAGLALSVLLIISELSRLKDRQELYEREETEEKHIAEKEEEPTEKEAPTEQKSYPDDAVQVSAPVTSEDEQKERPEAPEEPDTFNQVVSEAIATPSEPDNLLSFEQIETYEQPEPERLPEETTEDDAQDDRPSIAVKVPVKVKVRPRDATPAERQETTTGQHSAGEKRPIRQKPEIKPVRGVRGVSEEYDEHSGY